MIIKYKNNKLFFEIIPNLTEEELKQKPNFYVNKNNKIRVFERTIIIEDEKEFKSNYCYRYENESSFFKKDDSSETIFFGFCENKNIDQLLKQIFTINIKV